MRYVLTTIYLIKLVIYNIAPAEYVLVQAACNVVTLPTTLGRRKTATLLRNTK